MVPSSQLPVGAFNFISFPLPIPIPCLFIVRPNSGRLVVKVIPIALSKGVKYRPTVYERGQDIKVVDTGKIYLCKSNTWNKRWQI